MTQWVYSFGTGKTEGRADMRNLLGGKGANLAEMTSLGLPVPPGLTITTEVCSAYYKNGRQYPADLKGQVEAALRSIEKETGMSFGDAKDFIAFRCHQTKSRVGAADICNKIVIHDSQFL